MKKMIIIGQGPAGISAALYAVRGGADVTVVAKDGGALMKAEVIQNYYGFPGGISAKELVENGIRQAKELGVNFVQDEVCGIEFGADRARRLHFFGAELRMRMEVAAGSDDLFGVLAAERMKGRMNVHGHDDPLRDWRSPVKRAASAGTQELHRSASRRPAPAD